MSLRLRSLQDSVPVVPAVPVAPPAPADPPDWVEPPEAVERLATGVRSTTGAPAAARVETARAGATPRRAVAAAGHSGRLRGLTARAGSLALRADPGMPGARALAVVGVAGVFLAGVLVWTSRPRPQTVPAAMGQQAAVTAARSEPARASGVPAVSVRPSVVVHVAGRVRRPGVVTLPAGARVVEAIAAAGGLRPGTGADGLNLARPVVDGEQILVGATPPGAASMPGAPGTVGAAGPGGAPPGTAPLPPGAPGAPGAAGAAGADTRLDLNTATLEQFQQLPGVGPVLAQRIIDHRTRVGGFRSVDQLQEVTGIGARRFAELKDRVRV